VQGPVTVVLLLELLVHLLQMLKGAEPFEHFYAYVDVGYGSHCLRVGNVSAFVSGSLDAGERVVWDGAGAGFPAADGSDANAKALC